MLKKKSSAEMPRPVEGVVFSGHSDGHGAAYLTHRAMRALKIKVGEQLRYDASSRLDLGRVEWGIRLYRIAPSRQRRKRVVTIQSRASGDEIGNPLAGGFIQIQSIPRSELLATLDKAPTSAYLLADGSVFVAFPRAMQRQNGKFLIPPEQSARTKEDAEKPAPRPQRRGAGCAGMSSHDERLLTFYGMFTEAGCAPEVARRMALAAMEV